MATAGAAAHVPAGPQTVPIRHDAFAVVLHVSQTTGSDERGDGTAAKPFASVRHALLRCDGAAPAKRYAVLVAAGTYAGGVLEMKRHVDLYGGFEPASWNRDIARNGTTLDARQTSRVIVGADDARIDGLTLRGGRVRGPGGAILCDRTSPRITNNTIVDNETLEPENYNHDLLHQLGNDGGAIACLNGAAPLIANNVIAHNATGVGGGGGIASANYSTPTIENNVLSDNVTGRTDKNRSRSSNGAAVSCSNLPVRVVDRKRVRYRISGNVILNNRVGGNSDAGGIYCEYDAHPEISRNFILGNVAEDDGGGIYVMKSSEPLIAGNVIAGSRGGGAIRLSKEGRALIENNLLFANDAGSITCANSWMRLVHNTIVAGVGNGLAYENQSRHLRHSEVIGNIFYGKTAAQWRHSPAGSLTVTHNLLKGGRAEDGNVDADPLFADDALSAAAGRATYDRDRARTTLTLTAPPPDAGQLVGRPVRAGDRWGVIAAVEGDKLTAWGDLSAGQKAGELRLEVPPTYHLRAESPCIDKGPPAGGPAEDIDGEPRPAAGAAGRPDIGADEFRPAAARDSRPDGADGLFSRRNLVAWCIVPFDASKRTPEQRAEMLARIGLRRFAYDWRAEHLPTFEAELAALEKHKIELTAVWFPATLNKDARLLLDALKKHRLKPQLWVMLNVDPAGNPDAAVASAADAIRPIAREADAIGCKVALYNHGGWFGEPENQIAIISRLRDEGFTNVGIVYNLHHGHHQLPRFAELLAKMKPHLLALNLNGMTEGGDKAGKKILPLGQGELDLRLLKTLRDSGWTGPVGILNHTDEDAEGRLLDNLDGLDRLLPQLDGKPAGPQPRLRTHKPQQ